MPKLDRSYQNSNVYDIVNIYIYIELYQLTIEIDNWSNNELDGRRGDPGAHGIIVKVWWGARRAPVRTFGRPL